MKKYSICTALVLVTAVVCFFAGYLTTSPDKEPESTSAPETILETETASEPQLVVNQREVEPVAASPEEEFYLVSETGYLLVCLHTHIPISEFPEKEQEKLRAGIWFSSMMEIFHYLESYTS